MGRSCFLRILLVFALLVSLSFSHGFSRKLMETVEVGDSYVDTEKYEGRGREMIDLMEYNLDPEPNTNPKTGFINGPPTQGR